MRKPNHPKDDSTGVGTILGAWVGDAPPPAQDPPHNKDDVSQRDRRAVFDEHVPSGSRGSLSAMFTGIQHNAFLGRYDELALEVTLDDILANTTDANLYVFLDQSSDGVWWIQQSNQLNNYNPADAEVTLLIKGSSPGPASVVARRLWSEAPSGRSSAGPLLSYVRLRIFFDDANVSGHLLIYASSFDSTGAGRKPSKRCVSMIRDYFVAFNHYVKDTSSLATPEMFSSNAVAARLGRYDNLAIQVIVDNLSPGFGSTDGLTVGLRESADGNTWAYASTTLITGTVHQNATDVFFGYLPKVPFQPFLRLTVAFNMSTSGGHVKIHAILRDPSD